MDNEDVKRERLVKRVISFIRVKYKNGSDSSGDTVDCSSLIERAAMEEFQWTRDGFLTPGEPFTQARGIFEKNESVERPKPGDLAVYTEVADPVRGFRAYHVMMVLSDDEVIGACPTLGALVNHLPVRNLGSST